MKKIFIFTLIILQNTFNETEQHLPTEDTNTNQLETVTTDRKDILEKIINKYIKTGFWSWFCSQNHIKDLACAIDSLTTNPSDAASLTQKIQKLHDSDKTILRNIINDPEYHKPIHGLLCKNHNNICNNHNDNCYDSYRSILDSISATDAEKDYCEKIKQYNSSTPTLIERTKKFLGIA
jgi:hypothetical protein